MNNVVKHENCIHSWHRRIGYRDHRIVSELQDIHMVTGMYMAKCKKKYECCIQGKMTRISFPQISYSYTYQPIQLVHTVLCGSMRTISPDGKKYFLTFIDDFSRYIVTYLLTQKNEVQEKLEEYVAMVANLEEKCKSYKLSGEVENI